MGVEIVKVFPGGQVGGPASIKAVCGPLPCSRLMPTGGVDDTKEGVQEWIKVGVACLGFGSKLIHKDLLASWDYAAIRDNVWRVLDWIRKAREQ